MGTRGFLGWKIDGQVTLTYNHFDSYPTGLGVQVVSDLREQDVTTLKDRLAGVAKVEGQDVPTEEELILFAELVPNVTADRDWYNTLHHLQGDLAGILDSRITPEVGEDWARDSLFCEWGYLIDLDDNELQVYKGFQQGAVPIVGRWATDTPNENGYLPVSLIDAWPLTDLPSDEELHQLEAACRQ
jgi:hypothetical protein